MVKSSNDSDGDEDDENMEDWVNERDTMTVEQLIALDKSVQRVNTRSVSSEGVYGPGITKETKSEETMAFTSKPIYYRVHSKVK